MLFRYYLLFVCSLKIRKLNLLLLNSKNILYFCWEKAVIDMFLFLFNCINTLGYIKIVL